MRYVILDWSKKRYCVISVKIPDKKLPDGLICRSFRELKAGELNLCSEWKYEPLFKQFEKEFLAKRKYWESH